MKSEEAQVEVVKAALPYVSAEEWLLTVVRYVEFDKLLLQAFKKIDWSSRESILPMVRPFELIREHVRDTMLRAPQKIGEALARDGFRFNKEWNLVRLIKDTQIR